MKVGVLTFSYATFDHFEESLARTGAYSINLGDNAQTIAARQLLLRLGACADDIIEVDRDTLSSYSGPPVQLLMNAVFRPQSFPISDHVTPIFLGFCARPETLALSADYLKRHEPIGCRDDATADALKTLGVDAFTSGCVTLTLSPRRDAKRPPRAYFVHGAGAGAFPGQALAHAPQNILNDAEFLFHRLPVFQFPLPVSQQRAAERYEAILLDEIRDNATLVVTPLHHIAAPSIAMGVPTIICRKETDARFSFLQKITPIFVPGAFDAIDWAPSALDVSTVRRAYEERLRTALSQHAWLSGDSS